ncbi:protein HEG homolog 1-like isoform X2 [Rhineura floridana]|uniref:protein HEG homolog 1-like isoform X2 n=1 Tax=Rhineura floridana TaxID=261503 RepID=UPI002AC7FC8D|nr:protein HEG homolog 1-like isoform X2 [Rhineura floridana]
MRGGFCLGLALLQVGLGASWGLRAEHSTGNRSAGLDHHPPSPATWTTHLTVPAASGGNADAAKEPLEPPTCRGEEDCPPWSRCEDHTGRRSCRCGLGYHLSPALGCVPVRAFPGLLVLQDLGSPGQVLLGITTPEESQLSWVIASQVQNLFQHILRHLDGYLGSSTRDLKWSSGEVIILHHFSAWVPVTAQQVKEAISAFQRQCHNGSHVGTPACALLRRMGTYQSLSLCQFDICDSMSTTCSFQDGLVQCACRPGYLHAHPTDRTCTACDSGFWLQNSTCARCPFGFSGAGCQEQEREPPRRACRGTRSPRTFL